MCFAKKVNTCGRHYPKRYTPVVRCVPRVVTSILIVLTTIAQLAPSTAGARIIAPPHQSGIVDPSSAHNHQVATESRARRFVSTPGFQRADSHSDLAPFASATVGRLSSRVQPVVTPFSPQSFEPHSVRGRAPPISR